MGSPLGGILKGNAAAEQLFIWGVLSAFVASLLAPFLRAAEQFANESGPNALPSAELLADMVLRGHIDPGTAQDAAKRNGVNAEWFDRMVRNSGSPPAPGELAEALRRGIIPASSGSDTTPGYIEGIRQSRLQDQWADVIKALDTNLPTPEAAVIALVRSMLSDPQARDLYNKFGGDPQYFDLLFNNSGEGPTPVEAGTMANRGIIPWDGYGPGVTSFQQAVSESRFRNKWQEPFRALAVYRPPPRTITAMFREGSITQEQATQLLLEYGVSAALVPTYLTPGKSSLTSRAHEITEAEIVRLYREQGLDRGAALNLLQAHGYSSADIEYILHSADLQTELEQANASIAIVRHLYTAGKIERNEASSILDQNHVLASHRDYLLVLWDKQRQLGTRTLTAKQITDAAASGIFTIAQAQLRLMGAGYTLDDANVLLALALGNDASGITGVTVPGVSTPGAG